MENLQKSVWNFLLLLVPRLTSQRSSLKEFSSMQKRIERSFKIQHNRCIPIDRLSDEIITEILQYEIDNAGDNWSFKDFPLFPTYSICTRWRQVAIKSPSLWTRMSLPCPPRLFRLIRDRSRSNQLKVFVSNASGPDPIDTASLGESLRQLVPRISKLRVSWDWFATQLDMISFDCLLYDYVGQREFSALREIDLTDTFTDDPECDPIDLNAPALRKLIFEGLPSFIARPIPSLIDLQYKSCDFGIKEILNLLSYHPQLHSCSIVNTGFRRDFKGHHNIVFLNSLQNLVLDNLHVSGMEILLANLTLPASARLTLGTYVHDHDHDLFEKFFEPYLSKSDELKITSDTKNIIYSMTYKSRGAITIAHRAGDSPLPTLAKCPTDLSLIDIHHSILPPVSDLIHGFTLWSKIAHIRVCTEELQFENLLTALEETPAIVCPLLRILDCTGTEFSGLRMKSFLEFRENRGVCIQTLKFTRGFAHSGVDELVSSTTAMIQLDPVEVEESAEYS
ncbi:hypothetical protein SISSUDRAFT_1133497 [Sistotremastrum suecicum HHB10207 ss-3]|uniref:F-box domain-containing protein n=1 Tax=Sistotremastrum suecicum HHB10207 ss-3 TaxID=1314776 RepID=A0A165X3P0_9AGAM|nr:hypothetical protein SISSUDRAFT_1133497 [Sistotremastrum suecicum HHB10207 ss-3]